MFLEEKLRSSERPCIKQTMQTKQSKQISPMKKGKVNAMKVVYFTHERSSLISSSCPMCLKYAHFKVSRFYLYEKVESQKQLAFIYIQLLSINNAELQTFCVSL